MLLLAAPDEDENRYPPHPDPPPTKGRGKKKFETIRNVPSPLMREGEDEGDYFKTHHLLLSVFI